MKHAQCMHVHRHHVPYLIRQVVFCPLCTPYCTPCFTSTLNRITVQYSSPPLLYSGFVRHTMYGVPRTLYSHKSPVNHGNPVAVPTCEQGNGPGWTSWTTGWTSDILFGGWMAGLIPHDRQAFIFLQSSTLCVCFQVLSVDSWGLRVCLPLMALRTPRNQPA